MNLDLLLAKQKVWEGDRPDLYDDATGQTIGPSCYVKGNPTVGIGHNMRKPMSEVARKFLWNEDIQQAVNDTATLDWFAALDEPRQLAITDIMFNLGLPVFLTLTTFIAYMQRGSYSAAADDLETTKWYRQVGDRAVYLVTVLRTGAWS